MGADYRKEIHTRQPAYAGDIDVYAHFKTTMMSYANSNAFYFLTQEKNTLTTMKINL